jgi:hypothetical protein
VFEKYDGTSGCTWKRLGIELAANPVLGEAIDASPDLEI